MKPKSEQQYVVDSATGCWVWQRTLVKGYGQFMVDGVKKGAHVHFWERENGPVPEGLELDHLCRRPLCVRPSHCEAVTHAENQRRRAAAVTHCPADHPYDEVNTLVRKSGARHCRACNRNRMRARRALQKVGM